MIYFTNKRLISETKKEIWRDFYPDAKEEIPPNAPGPRLNTTKVGIYLDADNKGNLLNRHSHTIIIVYTNDDPMFWFSKLHNTVKLSIFGYEFITLIIAT